MKDRITFFFNRYDNKDTIPVFAFRHPVVAQLKVEVNGKNCSRKLLCNNVLRIQRTGYLSRVFCMVQGCIAKPIVYLFIASVLSDGQSNIADGNQTTINVKV